MDKKLENNLTKELDNSIKKVINLIEKDKENEARDIFNKQIYEKYNKFLLNKIYPVSLLKFFFLELDEYLNNEGAKILGATDKEKIIGSYYSDYQEDLKEALAQEKSRDPVESRLFNCA